MNCRHEGELEREKSHCLVSLSSSINFPGLLVQTSLVCKLGIQWLLLYVPLEVVETGEMAGEEPGYEFLLYSWKLYTTVTMRINSMTCTGFAVVCSVRHRPNVGCLQISLVFWSLVHGIT